MGLCYSQRTEILLLCISDLERVHATANRVQPGEGVRDCGLV